MIDTDGTGHVYEIGGQQTLTFHRREKINDRFELVHDGTTEEELIELLIDRLGKLNRETPSRANHEIMSRLHQAQTWLLFRVRKQDDNHSG